VPDVERRTVTPALPAKRRAILASGAALVARGRKLGLREELTEPGSQILLVLAAIDIVGATPGPDVESLLVGRRTLARIGRSGVVADDRPV
jgi:hypothetical protein